MKKQILSFILFLFGLSVFGQSKLSPYTENILSFKKNTPEESLLQSNKAKGLYRTDTQTYLPAYIHLLPDANLEELEKLGVKINLKLQDIITAQIPMEKVEEVAQLELVKYLEAAVPVTQMMDKARAASSVDQVQNGTDLIHAFKGKDIVIGVIDAGFQYGHANFYNIDKSELRIKRVWEQHWKDGTPPTGFNYGGEMTTTEEILKYGGDVTSNSHGTHVTGIAAGADTLNGSAYYGVAPEAEIVLVSMGEMSHNNVNLSDAVSYIYQYAESVNKPCVVNLSLGTHFGPHDGSSTFDRVCDVLQGKGRLLVGSVGNFGNDKFHISKQFTSEKDTPLSTLVEFKKRPSLQSPYGDIDIWGDVNMKYSLQVYVYNNYTGEKVDMAEMIDASLPEGNKMEYKWNKSASGSVTVTTEINPQNQKPHAFISLNITSIKTNHSIGITITPQSEGTVHAWADDIYVELTDNGQEGFTDGDNRHSLAEIGGTGKNIISVGAYVSRDDFWTEKNPEKYPTGQTLDSLGNFSSKGPAIDGRMKPDITAPGSYIISSISSNDVSILSQKVVKTTIWNEAVHYYAFMQGTSMAAPYVTGVIATWLQANPDLTPNDIRAILKKTAIRDEATGILPENGNSNWGLGKIDAWNGIKECISLASSTDCLPNSVPQCILLASKHTGFRLFFTNGHSDIKVTVLSMKGQIIHQQKLAEIQPSEEVSIQLSDASEGIYLVKIEGNNINQTYKLPLRN